MPWNLSICWNNTIVPHLFMSLDIQHLYEKRRNRKRMPMQYSPDSCSTYIKKSADNLVRGGGFKNIPFERVLYALGIRYVGETVAKKLAKHYKILMH
jgi:NAD-dependent DNA ligase